MARKKKSKLGWIAGLVLGGAAVAGGTVLALKSGTNKLSLSVGTSPGPKFSFELRERQGDRLKRIGGSDGGPFGASDATQKLSRLLRPYLKDGAVPAGSSAEVLMNPAMQFSQADVEGARRMGAFLDSLGFTTVVQEPSKQATTA